MYQTGYPSPIHLWFLCQLEISILDAVPLDVPRWLKFDAGVQETKIKRLETQ